MSCVGNVAELRQLIFSFADRRDLAVCARVSRIWTEDALDIVWKELPSPLPLLTLATENSLSPSMHWQPPQGFATSSEPVQWARFRSLSTLRKLALVKALCPDSMPLLPNLEEVEVHASTNIKWVPIVAMFLHIGVRRLVILPEQELQSGPSFFTYPDFFREVLLRAPLLSNLEIGESSLLTYNRVFRPEDPSILAAYASRFPTLTRLSIPAAVLACLQDIPTTFPRLCTLLESDALRRKMFFNRYHSSWPTRIANIENLAVSLIMTSANKMLVANRMSHLRILYLETNISQTQKPEMTELFHKLGDRCPVLAEVTMVWMGGMLSLDPGEIDISVLEPLVQCASLSLLDISAPCVLTFEQDGAARLASCLSNLRICRLQFIPLNGPTAGVQTLPGLAALLPFAFCCRHLEELSLVLAITVSNGVVDAPPGHTPFSPVFRKLSVGHFADAQGWNASAVARYLADLVPRYCSVVVPPRPHWGERWTSEDAIKNGEERLKEAFQLIPTYSRM